MLNVELPDEFDLNDPRRADHDSVTWLWITWRRMSPAKYAQLAIGTLPRDILVAIEQRNPAGLSAEDFAVLRRVLDLIRANADPNASPGEVFTVIEEALRVRYAKEIVEPPNSERSSGSAPWCRTC